MSRVTISNNFRVPLPGHLRETHSLKEDDLVTVTSDGDKISIKKPDEDVDEAAGIWPSNRARRECEDSVRGDWYDPS